MSPDQIDAIASALFDRWVEDVDEQILEAATVRGIELPDFEHNETWADRVYNDIVKAFAAKITDQ